ncbi:MAG: PGF-CTERM sorting domain-containing protein [Methanomicrobiaceae archaeon]|nr:PGF-CTERM sorting domain-containing protein [Methanomicrobiaceae archaeon]
MVLAAALVVAPAVAARTITTTGANAFVGEEDLSFTAVPAGETVIQWVHYSDPTAGTIDKTLTATNGVITELNKGIPTGSYYVFTDAAAADPANRLTAAGYVNVQNPEVTIDVVLNDSRKDSVNAKSVTRDNELAFKLTNNLNNFPGKMNIEVTLPGGGVTTQFGGQTLSGVDANGTTLYQGPVVLTDVAAGTYTAVAKWPAASDFYGKGFDSNSVTFEVLTKKLAITSNKDTVVRGNSFTVTITGESNKAYQLFVKDASIAPEKYPVVTPGQKGVDVPSYTPTNVTVTTNAAGTRSIQFDTNQSTDDRQFTIRVEVPGTPGTYDEVKVRVEKGAVTVTASGTGVYYIGEEITLSGTNTDSDFVNLFLTGPNLGTNGVKLNDLNINVINNTASTFTVEPVEADDTWSYKWDTSNLGRVLDSGGYTIYAVSEPRSKDALSGVQYATTSVQLKSAFITATSSGATVAKGDKLTITGTAQGNPDNVYVWIFGKNYYKLAQSATVESDSTFEYKLESGDTKDLSSGQYFVVIQHPMSNGAGVTESNGVISAQGITPVNLRSLQASDAASALINALDSPYVDDTYTKLTFVVEEPQIFIDPIGNKAAGSKFTITGTTNLAVGDKLNIDVTSAAFQPTTKTETSGFGAASGVATVEKGDGANKWSLDVDATGFKPDQYIVRVESVETDTTQTSTFNVIEAEPTTPPAGNVTTTPAGNVTTTTTTTTTTAATPTTTPGFGALVALAGLGAVAFLVLRRK